MNLVEQLIKLRERLTHVGFVGERKAMALFSLGFYATIFTIMGLIAMSNLPEWTACFFGLAACYGIGFFALAADWFWGRWFAIGLGNGGLTMAVMSLVLTLLRDPDVFGEIFLQMAIFGLTHAIVSGALRGEKMAAVYDARAEWRQRWKLDDQGVLRIKHSVTRTAASLPGLIMFALGPREGAAMAILAVGVVGLCGLLRGRTWGVIALGGAGIAAIASSFGASHEYFFSLGAAPLQIASVPPAMFGVLSGVLLVLAALPFTKPVLAFVLRRRTA
ncbi:MAG: hypothetical protein EXR72_11790 [Myxococcales bacterium]|nr:hypothetical protein [Myxococcales bacterium]